MRRGILIMISNRYLKKILSDSIMIIIILVIISSCDKRKQSSSTKKLNDVKIINHDPQEYILRPNSNDCLCIDEIERAKKDIKAGRIVFCIPLFAKPPSFMNEIQIRALCRQYKLNCEYEMFGDAVDASQTQGCYGIYMDKIIDSKYGLGFRKNFYGRQIVY